MLRKSPASNAWVAIFKNTDFPKSSLKVTTFSKLYYFFTFKVGCVVNLKLVFED